MFYSLTRHLSEGLRTACQIAMPFAFGEMNSALRFFAQVEPVIDRVAAWTSGTYH